MISFPDGLFEKFGYDALRVYRPDEDFVIKLRRWTPAARWYVEAYNELFGDRTPYEILGEEEYRGCPVLKLRQPYVEFGECTWEDARKDLYYTMKARFGDAEEHPWLPNELHLPNWFLDDLKEGNVGIDIRTKKYAVVDCIIHHPSNRDADLLWDIDRRQVEKDRHEVDELKKQIAKLKDANDKLNAEIKKRDATISDLAAKNRQLLSFKERMLKPVDRAVKERYGIVDEVAFNVAMEGLGKHFQRLG